MGTDGRGSLGAMWLASPAHARWLENEFDALAGFASEAGTAHGFGYLDDAGEVIAARGHDLFLTCRTTHVFALAHLLGRPGAASQVDHGIRSLTESFADPRGGWFSALAADGTPTDETKAAYAHAFVILAAASATEAERPGGRDLLGQALAVSEEHFWREEEGMVVESWNADFTECENYRGINANMHTVEAYLAAADASGNDLWLERAERITRRALDDFARNNAWRLPEHFTADWEPIYDYNAAEPAHPFRPAGATIGHWFEWARLALHVEAALAKREKPAPDYLAETAQALFEAGVDEGWSVDGEDGFIYTVDFTGAPLVRERMHWVVAEAIAAAAVLYRRTGEEHYERWYRQWWEYAAVHLIDPDGSWWHELSPSNDVSRTVWEGKPDIYHAAQATLIPRLPLAPVLATALRRGLLDRH